MAHKPKLGQNFLINTAAAINIVEALGDVSHATVLEIGPGRGAITDLLATRSQRLIAVELDRDLAPVLREHFAKNAAVEIIEQDILTTDLSALQQSADDQLLVLGNLPYYLTSDILLHLLAFHASIRRAVLMVQREVADRVAAHPGTRDYGLLSCTVQLYARVEKLFTLPPTAFSPQPDVYSTVLRLTMAPRFEELAVDPPGFIAFLKQSFAQKRKTLANNLRAAGYDVEATQVAFQASGVDPHARAEALQLEMAARLYRELRAPAPETTTTG
jgi:16S rRNA (adenine1518-N6/adenine1519-N6)-dimethyltransferase